MLTGFSIPQIYVTKLSHLKIEENQLTKKECVKCKEN